MEKSLYVRLQNQYYRNHGFCWRDAGENLEIIEEWIDGRYRDTYLVNHKDKMSWQLLDEFQRLLFLSKKAIDWKSMKKMGVRQQDFHLHANYGLTVGEFKDGVAMVEWNICSENFRNTDDVKEEDVYNVYGYIDAHSNVVVSFKFVSYEEIQLLHSQAVKIAKRIALSEARVRRIKGNPLYIGFLRILKYAIGYPAYVVRSSFRRFKDIISDKYDSDLSQEEDETMEAFIKRHRMKKRYVVLAYTATVALASVFPIGFRSNLSSVSVTDDMVRYNEEWLDSIPYLMGCARAGEAWACERLAECCRYGHAGMEKSTLNAMIYYLQGGCDIKEVLEEAYESNPLDEFGLINHLLESLLSRNLSKRDVLAQLRYLPQPLSRPLTLMERLLDETKTPTLTSDIIMASLDRNTTADEYLVAFGLYMMVDEAHSSLDQLDATPEIMGLLQTMVLKIPWIYNQLGSCYLKIYEDDRDANEKCLQKAFKCFYKANKYALLKNENAIYVLEYCVENNLDSLPPFSSSDLQILKGQYGTRLFEPKYPVVEIDEDPVELIEGNHS